MTGSIEEQEQAIDSQLGIDLDGMDFAEGLPDSVSPEQMDRIAPALIRYILQSGDGGYKDGVDEVVDAQGNPPNQANNWLRTGGGQFEGRFIDRRPGTDRVFRFEISNDGGGWTRSFQPISGVDG